MTDVTASLPTRTDLFFAPAKVGRVAVSYDRDARTYTVAAQGFAPRTTKSYTRAMDLVVGLA